MEVIHLLKMLHR